MLIVQELDNWHPRIAVVDIVSEARGINNCQTDYEVSVASNCTCLSSTHTFEELLLELGLCDLDFNGLVDLLCVSALVIRVVLDRSGEL